MVDAALMAGSPFWLPEAPVASARPPPSGSPRWAPGSASPAATRPAPTQLRPASAQIEHLIAPPGSSSRTAPSSRGGTPPGQPAWGAAAICPDRGCQGSAAVPAIRRAACRAVTAASAATRAVTALV